MGTIGKASMVMALAIGLSGCAAGFKLHYAPNADALGGHADGPGAAGALVDKNGVSVADVEAHVNPLALAADLMEWAAGLFHKAAPKPGA